MLTQKLRNIFVYKYVPIFKALGAQVTEEAETRQWEGTELKNFRFDIEIVLDPDEDRRRSWVLYISDLKSSTEMKTEMAVPGYFYRSFSEPLKSDDWRFFYGKLNGLVAIVLALLVAKSLGTTAWNARVRLSNDRYAYIKFTLRKIHIEVEVNDNERVNTDMDVDWETDMVARLGKILSLASL